MTWQIITVANTVAAAAYFGISWIIFLGLRATQQLGTNKLATATSPIFFTCAVMALDNGDDKDTRRAIEDTLRRSQALISDLLGTDEGEKLRSGDLRRRTAADVSLQTGAK
ncbi:MAG: hypothetical protein WKF94_16515 [Solirubrobacteraceae bacterium]